MFKPCLSLWIVTLVFSHMAFADVYKWVDENGVTHYSQQAPKQQNAKLIKTPPPPLLNPNDAQEKVDALIKQQQEQRELAAQQQQEQQQAAEQAAIKQQNCETAKNNLTAYMNNPGRRFIDADGNVTRLKEEDRQQGIADFQKQINEYCN